MAITHFVESKGKEEKASTALSCAALFYATQKGKKKKLLRPVLVVVPHLAFTSREGRKSSERLLIGPI